MLFGLVGSLFVTTRLSGGLRPHIPMSGVEGNWTCTLQYQCPDARSDSERAGILSGTSLFSVKDTENHLISLLRVLVY